MRKALILQYFVKYFILRIPNFLKFIFRLPNTFFINNIQECPICSFNHYSKYIVAFLDHLGAQGGFI